MSTAERTRAGLRRHPFLAIALSTGILNYRATARFLELGDEDAASAALRRLRRDQDEVSLTEPDLRFRLKRGVDPAAIAPASVGDVEPLADRSGQTVYSAIIAAGEVPLEFVATALMRLAIAGIDVVTHVHHREEAVLVVPDDVATDALRDVEAVARAVPTFEESSR